MLYPKQVILEITSLCNLRCKGCVLHGKYKNATRRLGHLDINLGKKIIDQIGEFPNEVNLTTHGGGEPLIYPHFKEIISYAKKYSNIKVGFLTNATLLTKDISEFLVEVGIEWIAFSIDGTDEELFKKVRPGGDLKKIENNVLNFIDIAQKNNAKIETSINMVLYDEVKHLVEVFVKKWLPIVDTVRLSYYRFPPSSKKWTFRKIPERIKCPFLWNQIAIASDGNVALCCEDYNVDIQLGNAYHNEIIKIWNNEKINRIRKIHENGEFDKFLFCKNCDTWADFLPKVKIDYGNKIIITERASGTEYRKLNEY